jgi:diaminopimelate epimerase
MIPFVKAHACGNDFLILDEAVAGASMRCWRGGCARATPALARMELSFWIGRRAASFFLRLFNADGSEAELSAMGRAAWRRGWRRAKACARWRWGRMAGCGRAA